jgi:outer membrane lipoprotein LolB
MKLQRPLTTALCCCLVMACAPLKRPPEIMAPTTAMPAPLPAESMDAATIPTKALENRGAMLSSWEISGAMAARSKRQSWSASLNWMQQGPGHYQIRLMGPLGSGTVLIEKHNGMVNFQDGPKRVTATDASQLLYAQTGIRLPIKHLYYWIQGIPAPDSTSQQHKHQQAVAQINQNGYVITYMQYMKVDGRILPSKIKLEGHGLFIKLVIKHWKV